MALTPQMRHSIQLLGMSVTDLTEYIDSVLESNPCLKKIVESHASHKPGSSMPYQSGEPDDEATNIIEQRDDPYQRLISQARMMDINDDDMKIVEYLIYELDDNGYIVTDLSDAAENLSVRLEDVDRCLDLIQSMDPPGIGARDVRECLELQLKRSGKEDSVELRIVDSFLTEVARNDIEAISRELNISSAEAAKAVATIKKLNPRPASTLLSDKTEVLTPELIVRVDKSKIRIEINRGTVPQLRIYNPYESDLDIIKDPEAREFLKQHMDIAKTLVDNIKRREDTICKVADYILSYQRDYILKKSDGLRSLTITDVANALNFHPSTISRAVANKHILINDKPIALSSLLSHGVQKSNGDITSKSEIKTHILSLVAGEDRSKPLSDEAIRKMLADEGVVLTRRTITKYRTALKILPTHLRKKK